MMEPLVWAIDFVLLCFLPYGFYLVYRQWKDSEVP